MTRPIVVLISLVICTLTVSAYATALGSPVVKEACRVAPERWVRGARADVDSLVEVIVAVKQSNGAELERILLDVSDPDSPRYGQHLARDAVDKLVAPAADDIMAVLMWLKDAGVDMDNVEATGNSDFITVVTTIGVAERLLGGVYYTWTHKEHPTFTVTRLGDCHYSMPARVAKAVDFVGPTIRFPAVQTTTTATSPGKQLNDDDFGGVTPSFLRKLYKVGDAVGHAANNNQSVASFLGQYYSPSDLQTFFGQFAPNEMGKTPAESGPNNPSNPGIEASLDIQYIMSVGANVPTTFWSTAGQQPYNPGNEPFLKFLTVLSTTSDDSFPRTLSVSYGDNEPTVNFGYAERVNTEFKKLGVRGMSIMFASGDGGVSGGQSSPCTTFVPTYPAGSPWVTAVGGTQGSNPEMGAGLSAGGFSDYWARPSYQMDAVKHYFSVASNLPDPSLYNHTGAGIPDVSAQAENFDVVVGGGVIPVAGTSCASPTFSGVLSLLVDLRLQAGKSSLGYLNPLFYKNPSMFTDITQGNNPGCNTNGFYAAEGWDPVTGLGTANYEKMKAVIMALP